MSGDMSDSLVERLEGFKQHDEDRQAFIRVGDYALLASTLFAHKRSRTSWTLILSLREN